ncbi:MAG: extracellular solute-binding protein [Alphaproteobacteria bacterium]
MGVNGRRGADRLAGVLLAALALGPAAALGQESGPHGGIVSHAMTMIGEPKYGPGFDHLSYADPDAPQGGTMRQYVVGTFDSLNPYILAGVSAAGQQLYGETLMGRVWDEPFTLYGLLAESVEMPEDRSWVVFTLRPEARWHDGTPVTADDIKFSIETMLRDGSPRRQQYAPMVASVAALDARTVRIDFTDQANRETPMIMGLMPIVSQAWFATHSFTEPGLEPMLASGPYRVAAVDAGRSVVLERVPDYWGADLGLNRGLYNFDRWEFAYFRDGTVAREAFFAGNYDVRPEPSPTQWATAYDMPAVTSGDIVREEIPNNRPSGLRGLVFNTRRAQFEDRRVREAIAYAFDFPAMNQTLFYGAYTRTEGMFDNSPLAFSGVPEGREAELLAAVAADLPAGIMTEPYVVPGTAPGATVRGNLGQAVALLAEAGWTVRDGALVDAAGTPFAFEILLVDAGDEKVALGFADTLGRLGMQVSVRTVDSAQYQERRNNFDFDMTVNLWGVTLSPGNEQRQYWSSAQADQPGSRNLAGVKSPAIDALIDALTNARSADELTAAARALDRAVMWGHYAVPLYHATADRWAYWNTLCHTPEPSLYGTVLEAWWHCARE